MEENYYRERSINEKLPIILLITIGVLLIGLIIFFLVKFLNKKESFDIENDFLYTAKEYFNNNRGELPSEVGECSSVTLEKLLASSMISKYDAYSTCNKYNTYLKACKLENSKYQYVPILSCNDINTLEEYSDWKDGTVKDLIADQSDVQFLFEGYEKKVETSTENILENWEDEIKDTNYDVLKKTTYYRYRDKEWLWEESRNEYYTVNDAGSSTLAYYSNIPSDGYVNSDNEVIGYKWYTLRNKATNPYKVYVCKSADSSISVNSTTSCLSREDGKTETVKEYYTCGARETNFDGHLGNYLEVSSNVMCDCSSDLYGSSCDKEKVYYPSGSTDVSREKVYYKSAPVVGAISDNNTKQSVSRYYKKVTKTTDKYYKNSPSSNAVKVGSGRFGSWSDYTTSKPKSYQDREIESRVKVKYQIKGSDEDFKKISDNYLSINDLITKFKSLGYDVNDLSSIKTNENLKYNLKMQYRNKVKKED